MKYSYIIWDWNGTLIDDVLCTVLSVNGILAKRGLKPTDVDEYLQMIEYPLVNYYSKLIDLNKFSYSKISDEYQENYFLNKDSALLMNGALNALKNFEMLGAKQLIISSFEAERLNYYVKMFDIQNYFYIISGAHNNEAGSKLDRAKEIMQGINPDEILVIGDSVPDFEMATHLNCDCVLVSNGHQRKSELLKCGCTVLNDLNDIVNLIK